MHLSALARLFLILMEINVWVPGSTADRSPPSSARSPRTSSWCGAILCTGMEMFDWTRNAAESHMTRCQQYWLCVLMGLMCDPKRFRRAPVVKYKPGALQWRRMGNGGIAPWILNLILGGCEWSASRLDGFDPVDRAPGSRWIGLGGSQSQSRRDGDLI
jgi:hypothetical protein